MTDYPIKSLKIYILEYIAHLQIKMIIQINVFTDVNNLNNG